MTASFYSHGKLLLSGEYAILDGALGLAVPTKQGQSLNLSPIDAPLLQWRSRDHRGKPWFETEIPLEAVERVPDRDDSVRNRLLSLLYEARELNPGFLRGKQGYRVETVLEFPRAWGLGSSSTLINNIAQWASVDAFTLQARSFGGSGYDIACAQHPLPILYEVQAGVPRVSEVAFCPVFADRLFFVYLNRKQDSREGISAYRRNLPAGNHFLKAISSLTMAVANATSLQAFEAAINAHEALISDILGIPPVKASHFPDYTGSLKSLGAWGGDFMLATGEAGIREYFKKKGYETVIPYSDMVL